MALEINPFQPIALLLGEVEHFTPKHIERARYLMQGWRNMAKVESEGLQRNAAYLVWLNSLRIPTDQIVGPRGLLYPSATILGALVAGSSITADQVTIFPFDFTVSNGVAIPSNTVGAGSIENYIQMQLIITGNA